MKEMDYSNVDLSKKTDEEIVDIAQKITDHYFEYSNTISEIAAAYHFEKGDNQNQILNKIYAVLKDKRSKQVQTFSDQAIQDCLSKAKDADQVIQIVKQIQSLNKQEKTQELINYIDNRRCSKSNPQILQSNDNELAHNDAYVITISHMGYIKRTPLSEYDTIDQKLQRRSRNLLEKQLVDSYGMIYVPDGLIYTNSDSNQTDYVEQFYIVNEQDWLLLFTEKGMCYWSKVSEIPETLMTKKGQTIQAILELEDSDRICTIVNFKGFTDHDLYNHFILLCTSKGVIKQISLEAFSHPRKSGVIALNIREGDRLMSACITNGNSNILLILNSGRSIHFLEKDELRQLGRTASGVQGITIDEGEFVVSMLALDNELDNVFLLTQNGFGKRSLLNDFRITHRGGRGVRSMNINEKTGQVIAASNVTDDNDLIVSTQTGRSMRIPVNSMRLLGRLTQGAKLINLDECEKISSVCVVPHSNSENSIDLLLDF